MPRESIPRESTPKSGRNPLWLRFLLLEKPGILVASPQMIDPFFSRTVILMCEHNDEGSMGLVVNRPLGIPLESVLEQLHLPRPKPVTDPVLWGGPVMGESGFLLVRDALMPPDEGSIPINERVFVTSSRDTLERAVAGEVASPYFLCLGYAGWGPGQLDIEIQRGTWICLELDESLIFDLPHPEKYDRCLATLGVEVGQIWMRNPVEE
jgi:putative transcriptional regulator